MKDILEEGKALIQEHYNNPQRVQTVSVRILEKHALYAELLADAFIAKAAGKDAEAKEKFEYMVKRFGEEEFYVERFYDHRNSTYAYQSIINRKREKITEAVTQ